jgi:hypothetical protein
MLIGPPGFCRQIFRNESLAQVGYLSHRDGCQAGALAEPARAARKYRATTANSVKFVEVSLRWFRFRT